MKKLEISADEAAARPVMTARAPFGKKRRPPRLPFCQTQWFRDERTSESARFERRDVRGPSAHRRLSRKDEHGAPLPRHAPDPPFRQPAEEDISDMVGRAASLKVRWSAPALPLLPRKSETSGRFRKINVQDQDPSGGAGKPVSGALSCQALCLGEKKVRS